MYGFFHKYKEKLYFFLFKKWIGKIRNKNLSKKRKTFFQERKTFNTKNKNHFKKVKIFFIIKTRFKKEKLFY